MKKMIKLKFKLIKFMHKYIVETLVIADKVRARRDGTVAIN